jgi:hypothetical protein
MKRILALLLVLPLLAFAGDKVTICHATSSDTNPYNEITVSDNAIGAHFDENGTPLAGHEKDLLLEEGHCPGPVVPPPVDPPQDTGTTTPPVVDPPVTPPVTPPVEPPVEPPVVSGGSGHHHSHSSSGSTGTTPPPEEPELPVGAPDTGGGWASSFWGHLYSFFYRP